MALYMRDWILVVEKKRKEKTSKAMHAKVH